MPGIEKKKAANELGKYAEELAANDYISRNYTILNRNAKIGRVEVDIIAQKEDTVVFIEVKARNSSEKEALEAVDKDKRKRMIKAADLFLKNLEGQYNYRFDIVTAIGSKENLKIEVFEDAFLAADLF
ncbi:MAG: YraN family protein [Muribaculaceae bacterium]|nr:YraN family protein [Muribaculaceae bacterium]